MLRKIILFSFFSFVFSPAFSQVPRKVSLYLFSQYNKTLSDQTKGNNPWGFGLGLQATANTKTKLKPMLEITGDWYLEDDKVLRLNPDGSFPTQDHTVNEMINVFAGTTFSPIPEIYTMIAAGPSFIGDQVLLGIKPTFGFYFSKSQRLTAKLAYIHIFNRDKLSAKDFGTLSIGVGVKLF